VNSGHCQSAPGKLGPDAGQPFGDVVDKGSGIPRGLVAGDQPADRVRVAVSTAVSCQTGPIPLSLLR
jgi:hypothetical protein